MSPPIAEWLESHINYETGALSKRATRPSIENMIQLCKLLGDPQSHINAIHITGTNGKTSTTRITESLLRSKGLYTGMFVSPHLTSVYERICIDSNPISSAEFYEYLEHVRNVEQASNLDEEPTWFEIVTAVAFLAMSNVAVDVAVLEVGMGGTFDATNVCESQVSAITNVSLDHVAYLGTTLEQIANEKSGIIKAGHKTIVGNLSHEVGRIIETKAKAENAELIRLGEEINIEANEQAVGGRLLSFRTPYARYEEMFLPLFGGFQGINAVLATACAEAFIDAPLEYDIVAEGFSNVRSPGRMEVVHRSPLVVLDGAHNVAGAQTFTQAFDEEFLGGRKIYVLGCTSDKDPTAMINAFNIENEDLVIATTFDSPRAMAVEQITSALKEANIETVIGVNSVEEAVDNAMSLALDDDRIIVTGSLYVVGAARESFSNRD